MKTIDRSVSRFLVFVGLVCMATSLQAQSSSKNVPMKGKPAKDFQLTAVAGELQGDVKLSDVVKEHPVVLVVLRGYPGYQCGICSRQVGRLVSQAKAFSAKDAKVLMVYPGPGNELGQRAEEFLKGSKLPAPFTLLLDPDYEFTNAYGLRWNAPRETAYPSTFVIGRDGNVAYSKISKGHGDRSSPDDVLTKL